MSCGGLLVCVKLGGSWVTHINLTHEGGGLEGGRVARGAGGMSDDDVSMDDDSNQSGSECCSEDLNRFEEEDGDVLVSPSHTHAPRPSRPALILRFCVLRPSSTWLCSGPLFAKRAHGMLLGQVSSHLLKNPYTALTSDSIAKEQRTSIEVTALEATQGQILSQSPTNATFWR